MIALTSTIELPTPTSSSAASAIGTEGNAATRANGSPFRTRPIREIAREPAAQREPQREQAAEQAAEPARRAEPADPGGLDVEQVERDGNGETLPAPATSSRAP